MRVCSSLGLNFKNLSKVSPKAEPFYVGQGDADHAQIQNFTSGKDSIMLAGESGQYKFESKDGNIQILTISGDLVVIVEEVNNLKVDEIVQDFGVFIVK